MVISTVGGEELFEDFCTTLVEAAIDTCIQWIIPSKFGADYDDPIA